MQLPVDLQNKIKELYLDFSKKELTETQAGLTRKYKEQTGESKSLISSKKDSLVYSISRMPATYSVIFSLVKNLLKQGFLKDIKSIADVGSGTGAGYFALSELFGGIQFLLFERDKFMIDTFYKLVENNVKVIKTDIVKDNFSVNADLTIASYVLSEMTESDRFLAVKKLLPKNNSSLLLIDTGTPEVYRQFMQIKDYIEKMGYFVVAPCVSKKCMIENDYCQFFARVERSSIHRSIKNASLSYEDEKYFYLLIQKQDFENKQNRVIRRPRFAPNIVEHTLCMSDGVAKKTFTKKEKELFKKAKKAEINDVL